MSTSRPPGRSRWPAAPAPLDLRPGEVHGDQQVAERLHGERLAVRDLARLLAAGDLVEGQVGPDPAGVHQGDLGAAVAGCDVAASWASAMRLASGPSVSRFGDRVMSAVIEPTTRLAIGADARLPAVDDLGLRRVGGGSGRPGGWSTSVRLRRTSPVRGLMVSVGLGDDPAEGRRRGDHPVATVRVGDVADVRLVGVAGDDQVDLRVQVLGDVDDRAGDADALPVGAGLHAALVEQHDDGLHAAAAQFAGGPVGGLDLVAELDALDAGLGDERRAWPPGSSRCSRPSPRAPS